MILTNMSDTHLLHCYYFILLFVQVCETKELLRDHVQMAHNKELTVIPRPTRAVSCDICQRVSIPNNVLNTYSQLCHIIKYCREWE